MADITTYEKIISEATLEEFIISKVSFSGDEKKGAGKGKLTVALTPALSSDSTSHALILDLNLLVNGIPGDDTEGEPAFTLDMSFRGIFAVPEDLNFEVIHDIDNNSSLVQSLCKQVYPVGRSKAQAILSHTTYKGINLPWMIDLVYDGKS